MADEAKKDDTKQSGGEGNQGGATAKAAPIAPVYAIHHITYGRDAKTGKGLGKVAAPGTLFRPTSQKEADELAGLKSTRPLTDAEAALFEKTEAGESVIG